MSFSFSVGNEEEKSMRKKRKTKPNEIIQEQHLFRLTYINTWKAEVKRIKKDPFFYMEYSVSLQENAGTAVTTVGFSKSKSCYEKLTKLILNWHKVTENGSFQDFSLSSFLIPTHEKMF